jgi:uncharacterized protein
MGHRLSLNDGSLISTEYAWRVDTEWATLHAAVRGVSRTLEPGSEEEFITHHHWGYTRQRDGTTIEYRVDHPDWRVWETSAAAVDGDVAEIYGESFAEIVRSKPHSAFVADGSAVAVYFPTRLPN